jgi:hypothetical protein
MDGMAIVPEGFDQIAVVVDWLDACRKRDLSSLMDLYAQDASLECRCNSVQVYQGRPALEAYWRPRLDAFLPNAFGLEEVTPTGEGVMLDYLSHEGKPVRIVFAFATDGKILHTRCEPSPQALQQQAATSPNPAR